MHLCQQKELADGRLVPVMKCVGCGARWRVENPAEIEALAAAIRAEGDRRERLAKIGPHGTDGLVQWWHTVADRILHGALLIPADVV